MSLPPRRVVVVHQPKRQKGDPSSLLSAQDEEPHEATASTAQDDNKQKTELQDNQEDSWQGPPPLASLQSIKDPSCMGVLGRTLQRALEQVSDSSMMAASQAQDAQHEDNDDDTSHASTNKNDGNGITTIPVYISREDVSRIIGRLGLTMAELQRQRCSLTTGPYQASSSSVPNDHDHDDEEEDRAVAALLRGRIQYYQRLHGKWRIVLDEVEYKSRKTLDPQRRRRGPKRSLWDMCQDSTDTNTNDDTGVNRSDQGSEKQQKGMKLEVLAYNDIE